jgi:hypothetical protein
MPHKLSSHLSLEAHNLEPSKVSDSQTRLLNFGVDTGSQEGGSSPMNEFLGEKAARMFHFHRLQKQEVAQVVEDTVQNNLASKEIPEYNT